MNWPSSADAPTSPIRAVTCYRAPNYDSTVSVIELETMRQMYKIDVAINLSRIKADAYGNLWVSSRGNYDDVSRRTSTGWNPTADVTRWPRR